MDGRTVRVPGADLFVAEAGDPTALTVVFLHGWPEDHSVWTAVTRTASGRRSTRS